MRPSKVLTKLRDGQPVMFYCLHLTDPSVWELASLLGLDCIWFDMEHHAHNMETANTLFRAARVGTADVIARPAKGEWMRALRMLEAGAHGLLYPRISDLDEARELVRWTKFAPLGERGFDGGNPDMPYCSMDMAEYIQFANDNTFNIIQIENPGSLDHVEAMLELDGIDGAMLGPADFTTLSGSPEQFDHPKVQQALDRSRKAAENTGKHWGMAAGVDRARQLVAEGAKLIFTGADIVVLKAALEALPATWGPLGLTFDNQLTRGASYMQKV